MAATKPLPARVPPRMPSYRWAEYCPQCGLSRRPWQGCSDAFHSSLYERAYEASMGAQVDPGTPSTVPGVVDKKPLGGPSS